MIAPETKDTDLPSPPTASFLTRLEALSIDATRRLLEIPKKSKKEAVARLTEAQVEQLAKIEVDAIAGFEGDLTQLENAIGMLRMGHHFGWKVLYLVHSKKTIRTYEDILGVKIRDIFPEEGPSAYRSFGLNLARRFKNFWRVAGGDIKIPKRKEAASASR